MSRDGRRRAGLDRRRGNEESEESAVTTRTITRLPIGAMSPQIARIVR